MAYRSPGVGETPKRQHNCDDSVPIERERRGKDMEGVSPIAHARSGKSLGTAAFSRLPTARDVPKLTDLLKATLVASSDLTTKSSDDRCAASSCALESLGAVHLHPLPNNGNEVQELVHGFDGAAGETAIQQLT